jgi:hypothetical protein
MPVQKVFKLGMAILQWAKSPLQVTTMTNVLEHSVEFYVKHIGLLLLFSIPFIIAFLIPVLAPFPTFNDAGAIFLRLASISTNLTTFSTAVIVFSILFSLLFLSFAIVAINVLVKHSRTSTKIGKEVIRGLETYTAKVFGVLLLYTIIIALVSIAAYFYNISAAIPAIIGILITPFFFYAPAAIVIDERSTYRAIQQSTVLFVKKLQYPVLWIVVAIVLISVFDLLFIAVGGTTVSRYLILVFNSLFIMPFLIVLQSQSYMKRFPLLKR